MNNLFGEQQHREQRRQALSDENSSLCSAYKVQTVLYPHMNDVYS